MTFVNQSKTELVYIRAVNRDGRMVELGRIEPGRAWPTPRTPRGVRKVLRELSGRLFAFTDGGIAGVLVLPDDHPEAARYLEQQQRDDARRQAER